MTKTLTEQWRDGTLPVGSYYIKLLGDVERIDFFEGLEWERTKDFGIEEVLGPVPDYMYCKGLIYDSIALNENRKKVSESTSKEYLIALLYSMEKVYTAKGRTWIDPDYKIEEVK